MPSHHQTTLMAERFRGYLPIVVDVETAGFNANTDALLEIAAVTLEMDENGYLFTRDTHSANVAPFAGANLEASALQFTGIDPWHPDRQALSEEAALNHIFAPIRKAVKSQGCKRAILVGHNAHFDHSFLCAATARNKIKNNPFHPFSTFDTVTLGGLACGQTVLSKICKLAGVDFDDKQAHSARYDAEKTAELFCRLVNRWKELGGWEF